MISIKTISSIIYRRDHIMTTLTTIKDALEVARNQLNYLNQLDSLKDKLSESLLKLGLKNEIKSVVEVFDNIAIKYIGDADYGLARCMVYTSLKKECYTAYILLHQVEGVKVGQ